MASLRETIKNYGVTQTEQKIRNLIKENKLKAEDLSVKQLYEDFVGEEKNKMGFISSIQEEVRTSAFSNIMGELLGKEMIDGYNNTPTIGDKLVNTYKTKYKDERLPGFTAAENPHEVKEGEDYPEVGISDKYVTLGTAVKKGNIISITEEAIYFDQTNNLVERAREIGEKTALDREKAILRGVLGITNCYYPLGVETALYGAAPYLITSNGLEDWTDIEKAELDGLYAMQDDSSDQDYISVVAKAILVPIAKKRTAQRILNAIEITHGDYDDATSVKTTSSNPVKGEYEIITSNLVHILQIAASVDAAVAKSSWWFGDFKRQFRWKEHFPLQVFKQMDGELKFQKDVVARFKTRYFGNIFCKDTRYVVKNNA